MTLDEATHAIKRGHIVSLRHALENGLDPNMASKLNVCLLAFAAGEGNTRIGRLLIDKGADVNHRDKWDQTPLAHACMKGRSAFVKLLLDCGAAQDFDSNIVSVEASLDWIGQHCGVPPQTMRAIRRHFNEAKDRRGAVG